MNDQDIAHLIVKPLVMLAVVGMITTLGRIAGSFRGRPGPETLVYPNLYMAVGLLCVLFAGGILWLGLATGMAPGKDGFGAWSGMWIVFWIGGGLVTVWTGFWRLIIEKDGLRHRDALGRERKVAWAEIERLRYNRPNQALVFDLRGGGKISAPTASGRGRLLATRAEQAGVRLENFRPGEVPDLVGIVTA
jgi:hypothetical protein